VASGIAARTATDRLLLVDLDGTLIDRNRAFRAAAVRFLAGHGIADEAQWLLDLDGNGYTPRADLAAALLSRYPSLPGRAVTAFLDRGGADDVRLEPPVRAGLATLRADGWRLGVVTNGPVEQQRAKLARTGLDRLTDVQVISEAVGLRKPDPAIFELAAGLAGGRAGTAWMVGDSPGKDIAGAVAAGCRSVWVADGRDWTEPGYAPTAVAADTPAALAHLARRP
jgi:putative hydrolase of the HAD superfamily